MSKLVTKDTLTAVAETIRDNYMKGPIDNYLMDSSDVKDVTDIIDPYYNLKTPLTFDILTDGNVVWKARSSSYIQSIYYKVNDGNWTQITATTSGVEIPVVAGDKVAFKDKAPFLTSSSFSRHNWFTVSNGCTFSVRGNIMSLINGDTFLTLTTMSQSQFAYLFSEGLGVVDAKNLILPGVASSYCYYGLFQDCSNLIHGPQIQSPTVAEHCYEGMFQGCVSMVDINTKELPATTLAASCYYDMFYDCIELVKAPTICAQTILNTTCLQEMFAVSSENTLKTKLQEITLLATGSGAIGQDWVPGYILWDNLNLYADRIFYKKAAANWEVNSNGDSTPNGIPYSWTVVNIDE